MVRLPSVTQDKMEPNHGTANGIDAGANQLTHPPAAQDLRARQAVASARAAQWQWRLEPLEVRIAALRRAARAMLRRRSEVIDLASREMGKIPAEGLFIEALGPLDSVGGWADVVRTATKRRRVPLNPLSFRHKSASVEYLPRGVVGVIAPWNFPAAGLYRSIFPALMTGNAVVLKPSEHTPQTSAWVVDRLAEELPAGVIQAVIGDGRVGAALVGAGIDACIFTGSVARGDAVRLRCAELGIPSSIEMGGKDAAIILSDCDLPRTVAGVTHWALSNAGQACGSTREIVREHVDEARLLGAQVVCGGVYEGSGLFYPPTLLDACQDRMAIVRDETFGPVLAIVRIDGVNEAVARINESRYGLGASIWSRDVARARRLAERLDVGVVNINNHSFSGAIAALPWSGTRRTGFGVANGPESLATFVRPRVTTVDESTGPDPYWMPYDRSLAELGEGLVEAQLGHFSQAWRLPLLMRRRLKTIRDFFR
jgi:acyl-CoA reductase-like NAD-dependent aldehyde dehydrogenase